MTGIDPRHLVQIEIPVTDRHRAKMFYQEVFGWQTSPAELHECLILEVPEGCPYGISLVPGQPKGNSSPSIIPYFRVDEPTTILHNAVRCGGAIVKNATPLIGYGVLHHLQDPDGNVIGIIS
jgi:hypothetical protein